MVCNKNIKEKKKYDAIRFLFLWFSSTLRPNRIYDTRPTKTNYSRIYVIHIQSKENIDEWDRRVNTDGDDEKESQR